MKRGGAGCAVSLVLILIGFVCFGIGATNRKLREARPLGAFIILLSVVPGLVGGGFLIAGSTKKP